MQGSAKIGVLGVPFWKGQPKTGTELAPEVLRRARLLEELRDTDNEVEDHGDVDVRTIEPDEKASGASRPRNVGSVNQKLSDKVKDIIGQGQTCLMLGGDHSLGIGSIHGHQRAQKDVVVLWVDAHSDINTPLSSPSGNIHGMPLAFLVKELNKYVPSVPGFDWITPCMAANDVAYIGLRDIDGGERAILDMLDLHCFSMQEVDKYGIGQVVERALKAVDPSGTRPIHVSFDVDGVDPEFTPSTGTPVPGGLTMREALCIAEEIAATGRLHGLDIVEINPSIGTEEDVKKTVDNSMKIIKHFFGQKRHGNIPRGYSLLAA